jgi:hypothetical protein
MPLVNNPSVSIGASLTVKGPVKPGQPLQVSWSVVGVTNMGNVTATITLGATIVYSSKPLPVKKYLYVLGYSGAGEVLTLSFAPTDAAVKAGLYLIPTNPFGVTELVLTVVGDGADKGPLTAVAWLRVQPETLDASWWSWDSLGPDLIWNIPYTVAGSFTNQSPWSQMNVRLTLLETVLDSNLFNPTTDRGTVTITTGVGQNPTHVEFASIDQDWSWITCPSGSSNGPHDESFNYSVVVNMQDSWGNVYPALTIGPLWELVTVPHNKRELQDGAVSAFGASVGAAISGGILGIFSFGVGAGVAAAVGTGLAALAAGLCTQAQDPPAPDFDFYDNAKVLVYPLGKIPPEEAQLPATMAFLGDALECVALMDAMSQTEGKLMGARMKKNEKAVAHQVAAHEDFRKRLMVTAKKLSSGVKRTTKELDAELAFSVSNTRAAIRYLQVYGIPESLQKTFEQLGCPCTNEGTLQQFVKSVDTTALPPMSGSFAIIANSLVRNANYLNKNARMVAKSRA